MCGITGYFNFDGRPAKQTTIKEMTKMLDHRGPDGSGVYLDGSIAFGHTRLSIIDLSEKASQPMVSKCKKYIISYNGEIYNYLELRKELIKEGITFKSNSDTEVILNGFIKWKHKLLDKLNGMFAFAILDKNKNNIFLVRDRYGIKPLYYTMANNCFIFASEIKSFFKHPEFKKELEKQSIFEYFTFQNFFSDNTLFKNVFSVLPGHYFYISNKKIIKREYWDFSFDEPVNKQKNYDSILNTTLKNAVRRQHVSDVEIGCYLSGGMDSGAITSISSNYFKKLKTFTIGYDKYSNSGLETVPDERDLAELMSYVFKTEHYEMVLKAGDMEQCMKNLIWHLEVPRVGQSYPNYYASKLASKFCKVVLTGTGGDELFAGYPWRYYRAVVNENFNNYCKKYFQFWKRMIPDESYKKIFSPINNYQNNSYELFEGVLKKYKSKKLHPKDYVNLSLYLEAKTFLVGLLEVEDKLAMSHGLESRVPFLDNDLVELSTQIPVNLKLGNLQTIIELNENDPGIKTEKYFQKTNDGKLILRKIMENYIPIEITQGIKTGFVAPDAKWFKGESIEYVKKKLLKKNSHIFEFLDREEVYKLVNHHLDGKENRRLLIWSLLCFDEWIDVFLN